MCWPHCSRRALRTVASHANFNTEVGLPLTLCRIEDGHRGASSASWRCGGWARSAYLAEIARPDVAVITSIGPVHLEQVGTIEGVAEAKAEILDRSGRGGTAVVPYAEPLLAPYLDMTRARVETFGEADGADVRLAGFAPGRAEIEVGGRTITVPVNFDSAPQRPEPGGCRRGLRGAGPRPGRRAVAGAAEVEFSRWRGERIELPGDGFVIADCYNANPVSMRAALRHLVAAAGGRRTVAVLGRDGRARPGRPRRCTRRSARGGAAGRRRGRRRRAAQPRLRRALVRRRRDARPPRCPGRARAGRRGARQGQPLGGPRGGRRGARREARPRVRRRRDAARDRRPARRSSRSCAATSSASTSARTGPPGTPPSRARPRWAAWACSGARCWRS